MAAETLLEFSARINSSVWSRAVERGLFSNFGRNLSAVGLYRGLCTSRAGAEDCRKNMHMVNYTLREFPLVLVDYSNLYN